MKVGGSGVWTTWGRHIADDEEPRDMSTEEARLSEEAPLGRERAATSQRSGGSKDNKMAKGRRGWTHASSISCDAVIPLCEEDFKRLCFECVGGLVGGLNWTIRVGMRD
ncbi:hypothetical protein HN51_001935 [Arachis hypogaea]